MNKLIKAEWYRFTRSSMFKVFVFLSFFPILMHYISDPKFMDKTLCENMIEYTGVMGIAVCMFLSTVISANVGTLYYNRTGFYEIMDGNSPSNIIISKLVVYVSSAVLAVFAPIGILSAVIAVKNGVGTGLNLPLFYLMLALKTVHIIALCLLITLTVKSLVGAAFPYIRFFTIELMGLEMVIMAWPGNTTLQEIVHYFPAYQINYSLNNLTGDCGDYVFKMIISFLIEIPLAYLLAHISFKKKLCIK